MWDPQWVFKWTYLFLLLRVRHFHLDDTNIQMQTHLESKIMDKNLAVILRQFNYGKNSFIVLIPCPRKSDIRQCRIPAKFFFPEQGSQIGPLRIVRDLLRPEVGPWRSQIVLDFRLDPQPRRWPDETGFASENPHRSVATNDYFSRPSHSGKVHVPNFGFLNRTSDLPKMDWRAYVVAATRQTLH